MPPQASKLPQYPSGTGQRVPAWATVSWVPEADERFYPIRKEVDAAWQAHGDYRRGTDWLKRADLAAEAAVKQPANTELLYRASLYYFLAQTLDPVYNPKGTFGPKWVRIKKLWRGLKAAPHSYEFSRAGYLISAGSDSGERYGSLGPRLLKRNPKDRWVVFCYVADANYQGDGPGCWERAFDVMSRYAGNRVLDYRENWFLHTVNFYMWRLKQDSKYLKSSLSCLDKMLERPPRIANVEKVKAARDDVLKKLEL